MKELKFRAWDGKKMIEDVIPVSETDVVELFEYEHQVTEVEVVEQYTGLKDKNGKEIYEGDIVRFALTDGFNYVMDKDGVVTYKLGAFYVVNGLTEYLISDINTNKVEVIGNEFEIEVRMK